MQKLCKSLTPKPLCWLRSLTSGGRAAPQKNPQIPQPSPKKIAKNPRPNPRRGSGDGAGTEPRPGTAAANQHTAENTTNRTERPQKKAKAPLKALTHSLRVQNTNPSPNTKPNAHLPTKKREKSPIEAAANLLFFQIAKSFGNFSETFRKLFKNFSKTFQKLKLKLKLNRAYDAPRIFRHFLEFATRLRALRAPLRDRAPAPLAPGR